MTKGRQPTDSGALEFLFSYGTLQEESVQFANFGRVLVGEPDELPGHTLTVLTIVDPEVIAISGSDRHPMLIPSRNPRDSVAGTALALSAQELLAADRYEVEDYGRTQVTLKSGRVAWVYLDKRHIPINSPVADPALTTAVPLGPRVSVAGVTLEGAHGKVIGGGRS